MEIKSEEKKRVKFRPIHTVAEKVDIVEGKDVLRIEVPLDDELHIMKEEYKKRDTSEYKDMNSINDMNKKMTENISLRDDTDDYTSFIIKWSDDINIKGYENKISILKLVYKGRIFTKSSLSSNKIKSSLKEGFREYLLINYLKNIEKEKFTIVSDGYNITTSFDSYLVNKKFSVEFLFRTTRAMDVDNMVKSILDIIFEQDSVIYEIYASKIKIDNNENEGFDMVLYEIMD